MVKTMFLVPRKDNNGKGFRRGIWEELDARIVQLAGGYRRQPGGEGTWIDSGTTYRDRVWEYTVSLQSVRDIPRWLELIAWIRTAFEQEAVYVELNGSPELL